MVFIIRLDKFLCDCGFGSRSEIKNIAKSGRILVNGVKITKTDIKIDENYDIVNFCGNDVSYQKNIYIMLNKKAGFVTANTDNLHKTIFELLDEKLQNMKLFAVGRLDKDTEGLLLLTNDGEFSHALMSPKKHVNKVYYAEVSGEILPEHIKKFADGVEFLDGTVCKSAKLKILSSSDKSTAVVTISEGKFHQVKIMFKTIGCEVLYLKRVQIGNLKLDENLQIGEYRFLTDIEVKSLLKQGENTDD